jgi:uncharacterized protein YukE
MANQIKVHYESLDMGSAAMKTGVAAHRGEVNRYQAAARSTYDSWSADTRLAHEQHMAAWAKDTARVHELIDQHQILTTNHRNLTQQTDNTLAGKFTLL